MEVIKGFTHIVNSDVKKFKEAVWEAINKFNGKAEVQYKTNVIDNEIVYSALILGHE